MAREAIVASPERVEITYRSAAVDAHRATDLPSKMAGAGARSECSNVNLAGEFEPEALAARVPELRQLLELRSALTVLKGPLGDIPAFRRRIQSRLGDEAARERWMHELGIDTPR